MKNTNKNAVVLDIVIIFFILLSNFIYILVLKQLHEPIIYQDDIIYILPFFYNDICPQSFDKRESLFSMAVSNYLQLWFNLFITKIHELSLFILFDGNWFFI
ncbi:hypothetical protein [Absiella sp. AM54-8XD]|uniref:hypothetical protein n=1 Tax=Absiella sp. AM54-8XD TaxID=2292279 RepID=UPI0011C0D562|nr:hypothetical protein [Absiella sp. AM54-8XD]